MFATEIFLTFSERIPMETIHYLTQSFNHFPKFTIFLLYNMKYNPVYYHATENNIYLPRNNKQIRQLFNSVWLYAFVENHFDIYSEQLLINNIQDNEWNLRKASAALIDNTANQSIIIFIKIVE